MPEESEEEMTVKLRDSVQWFAEIMEEVLRKHDSNRGVKGWIYALDDWENEWYFKRLKEEVEELTSIQEGSILARDHQLISEAADVANFAMMIADRARTRIGKGIK